jgi:hypothetical protein
MKILLSNDDGYQALGLQALFAALKTIADVEVVAPEHNNSAKSNALTLHAPLYVRDAGEGGRYVTGTPADCVHVALTGLLGEPPDLVVSGINNGANMGDDTIYSGTVGAAMEGYLFGIPAIAFSLVEKGWPHLDTAAAAALELVKALAPAVAAQRQRAQRAAGRPAAAQDLPPGPAPLRRARHPPGKPAWRDHVLDRCRGRHDGRRGRHRFPRHRARPRGHHAADGRPDRPQGPGLLGPGPAGHARQGVVKGTKTA